MTNAERQRKFRHRKQASGLCRRDAWTDSEGLLAPATEEGGYANMTQKQFVRRLEKLVSGYEEWEREMIYAEVFEYAKRAEKKLKAVFEAMRKLHEEYGIKGNNERQ